MPEIAADPPMPACYHLFPAAGIQEYQPLDPDPVMPRAGAFREGKLRQSAGRPRGIANRKRRVPDLAARPLTVQAPAKDQMPAGQVYRPRHHLRARWSIARRLKENPDRTVAAAGCAQVEKNMGWLIKLNLAGVLCCIPPPSAAANGAEWVVSAQPWLSFAPTVDNYFKQGLYATGIAMVESSNGPLYTAVFCPGPDGAEWVLGNYLWKDFAKQTDTYVSDEDVGGRNKSGHGEKLCRRLEGVRLRATKTSPDSPALAGEGASFWRRYSGFNRFGRP